MDTTESRQLAARLADLLRNERFAMADFLVALAEFDRERGWVELGYSGLFAFLRGRLGLSKAASYFRKTAAELIQRYPEIVAPLKDGRLCITTMASLAKVLTPENAAAVLPRFFNQSGLEAKQIAAELAPAVTVPKRTVITAAPMRSQQALAAAVSPSKVGSSGEPRGPDEPMSAAPLPLALTSTEQENPVIGVQPVELPAAAARPLALTPTRPVRAEPLTATETRLHLTVSPEFLKKLEAARLALSHSVAGATVEDVLAAGLDLVLAKDAKRKAVLKKPRVTEPSSPAATPRSPPPTTSPPRSAARSGSATRAAASGRSKEAACAVPSSGPSSTTWTCAATAGNTIPRA